MRKTLGNKKKQDTENATRTTVNANAYHARHTTLPKMIRQQKQIHKILTTVGNKKLQIFFGSLLWFDLRQTYRRVRFFFFLLHEILCWFLMHFALYLLVSSLTFFDIVWSVCNDVWRWKWLQHSQHWKHVLGSDTNNPPNLRTFFTITLNFIIIIFVLLAFWFSLLSIPIERSQPLSTNWLSQQFVLIYSTMSA